MENELLAYRDNGLVPVGRYISQEFFELERSKLWSNTWLMACRLEEIPDIGDYTEFRILDRSILLVRDSEESVRAFYNSCRHRGTALAEGAGSFPTGQIVCSFHGWRYNIDGTSSYVYAPEAFPQACIESGGVDLLAVAVEVRWGMVWVRLSDDGPSFDEHMTDIAPVLDSYGLEDMRAFWWGPVVLDANWKVAQEAFMEGYHLMQSHPEISMWRTGDAVNPYAFSSGYRLSKAGHAWTDRTLRSGEKPFLADVSAADLLIESNRVFREGADAMVSERQYAIQQELVAAGLEGDELVARFMERIYEDAAEQGLPMRPPSPLQSGNVHVFPHITFAHLFGNLLMYRSRPNGLDPNSCIFDFWSLGFRTKDDPATRPEPTRDLSELWFIQQDITNIQRQQVGLRARDGGHMVVSPELEHMITNFHETLDRHLFD